ncbi:MAG: Uma2 family endonuclease [Gemmataceae bacterium]|nr:Uma2 family endonuclease [Gemmataceae bacterium]
MRDSIRTAIKIGPEDHGRPMTLEDFEYAVGQPGHIYELSRGVIAVSDVPGRPHGLQVFVIRRQLTAFDLSNPGRIHFIGGTHECKLLIPEFDSERHPDIAVYLTPWPPENQPWAHWIPEIVIEVVSVGSEERDYVEKREEYLALNIKEYWILDLEREEMVMLRRWGKRIVEKVVRPPETYKTRLLPGFELVIADVFRAAQE